MSNIYPTITPPSYVHLPLHYGRYEVTSTKYHYNCLNCGKLISNRSRFACSTSCANKLKMMKLKSNPIKWQRFVERTTKENKEWAINNHEIIESRLQKMAARNKELGQQIGPDFYRRNPKGKVENLLNVVSGWNMAYKGLFKPINPSKYRGNPTNIWYRSSYELKMMTFLDKSSDVLTWASEEVIIPYWDKATNKKRRYYPDFYVKFTNGKEFIVELKPRAQCKPPLPPKDNRGKKRYINECLTWATNSSKWESARKWCEQRGYKFIIMDEYNLGIK